MPYETASSDCGASGLTLHRKEFEKLINHITQTRRKFRALIVSDFTRISRKTDDFTRITDYLSDLGITAISAFNTTDDSLRPMEFLLGQDADKLRDGKKIQDKRPLAFNKVNA